MKRSRPPESASQCSNEQLKTLSSPARHADAALSCLPTGLTMGARGGATWPSLEREVGFSFSPPRGTFSAQNWHLKLVTLSGAGHAMGHVVTTTHFLLQVSPWIEQLDTMRASAGRHLPHNFPFIKVQQGSWRGGVKWCKLAIIQCMGFVHSF